MAFRWRADDGPLIVVVGSSPPPPHQLKIKQKHVKVGPPLTKLSGSMLEKVGNILSVFHKSSYEKFWSVKLLLFPYPSVKTYVLVAQKNHLIEMALLSTTTFVLVVK